MPRNRMIKTEFWNDEKLATVSRDARLTFIALWNLSDDYGSVRGHHLWLKNSIYPYDEIKPSEFKKWMEELENINAILAYEGDGEKFYYIRCFTRHQVIGRPSQFKNPPPPVSLIESSLSPHGILADEAKRESKSKRESKREEEGVQPTAEPQGPTDFEKFWEAYPRKVGKAEAQRSWKKNKRPEIKTVLEAITRQRSSPQWTRDGGRFIPNPATWLNQGRWDDAQEAAEPGTVPKCYREAEPASKRDEKVWMGPVPEDFKKVFEKIGKVD